MNAKAGQWLPTAILENPFSRAPANREFRHLGRLLGPQRAPADLVSLSDDTHRRLSLLSPTALPGLLQVFQKQSYEVG